MAKKKTKKDQTPYIVDRVAGALMQYKKLPKEDAYRISVMALQGAGLMRPGTFQLTELGKEVQRRLKIKKAHKNNKGGK